VFIILLCFRLSYCLSAEPRQCWFRLSVGSSIVAVNRMVCCLLRQVAMFVNGLFENRNDLGAFKNQLRDFLIQSKEFSAQVGSFHDNLTLMVLIMQLFMKLMPPISYALVVRRLVVIGFHDGYDHVIIMLVLVWPELTILFTFKLFLWSFLLNFMYYHIFSSG